MDEPEYYAALGRLGLDILAHRPFRQFTVVVTKAELNIEYVIHDPRAVTIVEWGDSLAVGLLANEDEKEPSDGFHESEITGIRMDDLIDSEDWYTRIDG